MVCKFSNQISRSLAGGTPYAAGLNLRFVGFASNIPPNAGRLVNNFGWSRGFMWDQ
jgi:hypothetical protein